MVGTGDRFLRGKDAANAALSGRWLFGTFDQAVVARGGLLRHACGGRRVDALGAAGIALGRLLFRLGERPGRLVDQVVHFVLTGRVLSRQRQAGLVAQRFTALFVDRHGVPPDVAWL